jgi:hypothetical protein
MMPSFIIDDRQPGRARLMMATIGRVVRSRVAFTLTVLALAFGVVCELPLRSAWRRSVRAEFTRALRQAIGGGLVTVVIVRRQSF